MKKLKKCEKYLQIKNRDRVNQQNSETKGWGCYYKIQEDIVNQKNSRNKVDIAI